MTVTKKGKNMSIQRIFGGFNNNNNIQQDDSDEGKEIIHYSNDHCDERKEQSYDILYSRRSTNDSWEGTDYIVGKKYKILHINLPKSLEDIAKGIGTSISRTFSPTDIKNEMKIITRTKSYVHISEEEMYAKNCHVFIGQNPDDIFCSIDRAEEVKLGHEKEIRNQFKIWGNEPLTWSPISTGQIEFLTGAIVFSKSLKRLAFVISEKTPNAVKKKIAGISVTVALAGIGLGLTRDGIRRRAFEKEFERVEYHNRKARLLNKIEALNDELRNPNLAENKRHVFTTVRNYFAQIVNNIQERQGNKSQLPV